MIQRYRWHYRPSDYDRYHNLALLGEDEHGERFIGRQVIMEPMLPEAKATFVTTDRAEFVALMDTLWEAGFRPSNYRYESDATMKHLGDMRTIAYHLLKINK